MSPHTRLAAVFVILALTGCAQVATSQGQAPTLATHQLPAGNILRPPTLAPNSGIQIFWVTITWHRRVLSWSISTMARDVDLTSKPCSTTEPPRSAEMSTYARSRDMRSSIDNRGGEDR